MASPTRVDWDAARAFFIALEPSERTYPRVADHFSVSVTTVKKWARIQEWQRLAAEADKAAYDAAMKKVVKSRTERVAETLRYVDAAVGKATVQLDEDELIVKPADVAALVKLAELLVGEPTDRVQVSQLRPLLDAYDEALDRLRDLAADKEAADAVVARLDEDLLAFAAQTRNRETA